MERGDTVVILNRNAGGKYVIEGNAVLVRPDYAGGADAKEANRWLVRFLEGEQRPQIRQVDPNAQVADPKSYVTALNKIPQGRMGGLEDALQKAIQS